MHFTLPPVEQKPAPEPPALVRTATREDVLWNRPVFKAPPLYLHPQAFDSVIFAPDRRWNGSKAR
jgi:hypothetical protein